MFKPVFKHFKKSAKSSKITGWKCKGLSEEVIKPPGISNNSLNPEMNYVDNAKTLSKI